jgi:hypothetical protein
MAVYPQMNYASRVVGPAEDYLLDGQRQPSPVALLYNLTSETWISGRYGVFSDRLYTYLALRHRHQRVDVVLEEDLTLERLAPYRVLYLNGLNIRREAVPVLRQWVEAGGTLVATAGSLFADEYDEPLPGAAELLGATQRLAGVSRGQSFMPTYLVEHDPIDRITVQESPVTPAVTADVIGLKCVLTPTTGKPIASYADGTCAGVWQELGKGRVLFLGIMPGLLYAQNAPRDDEGRPTTFKADRRELATAAAVRHLPPPPAEYSSPLVEVIRFDHPEAIAVVAVDFTYRAGTPGTLTVRTDRQIKEVSGTIAGKLTFRREGDAILVDFPTPNPSDVVILR